MAITAKTGEIFALKQPPDQEWFQVLVEYGPTADDVQYYDVRARCPSEAAAMVLEHHKKKFPSHSPVVSPDAVRDVVLTVPDSPMKAEIIWSICCDSK